MKDTELNLGVRALYEVALGSDAQTYSKIIAPAIKNLRWLEKSDGTRVLQACRQWHSTDARIGVEWSDIEVVRDE